MKYAVLSGNERFEIREGELKSNGCAVLQVTHVGVCGTDTSYWHEGDTVGWSSDTSTQAS